MKDKRKNISIVILLILSLAGVFMVYQYSYAKYLKTVNGRVGVSLARWQILVNNEDISKKNTLSNNIEAVLPGNEYINSGILAPGATGYFDLIIDPSNVDVAFKYDISITNNNAYSDIKVSGYEINPGNNPNPINFQSGNTITNIVPIGSSTFTIRVYIEWYDESDNDMNNSTDTDLVLDNVSLTYTASITFTQIKESSSA